MFGARSVRGVREVDSDASRYSVQADRQRATPTSVRVLRASGIRGQLVTPQTLFSLAIVAIVVLTLVAMLWPKRQPPEKSFTCSRCRAVTRHSNRTVEAWRSGKPKFFCQACHSKWLRSHPPPEHVQFSSRGPASGGSGCLGVVVLLACLPLGALLLCGHA